MTTLRHLDGSAFRVKVGAPPSDNALLDLFRRISRRDAPYTRLVIGDPRKPTLAFVLDQAARLGALDPNLDSVPVCGMDEVYLRRALVVERTHATTTAAI